MATTKSARKRLRQSIKLRLRNRRRKGLIKDSVRQFESAVSAGQSDQAAARLKEALRLLDRVAAKGTIHKNTAARKKSRLAKRLAKLQKGATA